MVKNQDKWLILGTGGIGRGLVAQIAQDSGFSIVFGSHSRAKKDYFQKNSKYTIWLFDPKTNAKIEKKVKIEKAIDITCEEELIDILSSPELKIISTSVRVDNLESVAKILAPALAKIKSKKKLLILVCENVENNGDKFKKLLEKKKKGVTKNLIIPNLSVDCFIPPQDTDTKILKREKFGELKIENQKTKETSILKKIKNTEIINDKIIKYYKKKIIGVSGMHAGIAWFGFDAGHKYVHQAAADPKLQKTIDKLVIEFSEAIIEETGFPKDKVKQYVKEARERVGNKNLKDPNERFFRNLPNKLQVNERFLGPALTIWQKGIEPEALIDILAIGFKKLIKDEKITNPKLAIKEICQIPNSAKELENKLLRKVI